MAHTPKFVQNLVRVMVRTVFVSALVAGVSGFLITNTVLADDGKWRLPINRPIDFHVIEGFAEETLLGLTYPIQYMCVHDFLDDLDHDGVVTPNDSEEHERELCTIGRASRVSPIGEPIAKTRALNALVPFFDYENDGEASLGGPDHNQDFADELESLFGIVPDAYDPNLNIAIHCPHPGPPISRHTGTFGTCAMHPIVLDMSPLLSSLFPQIPSDKNLLLPLVNHIHVIEKPKNKQQWFRILVNLVTDSSVWPDQDGTRGITSLKKLRVAQTAGYVSADIPTNMFFFFGSQPQRGQGDDDGDMLYPR